MRRMEREIFYKMGNGYSTSSPKKMTVVIFLFESE